MQQQNTYLRKVYVFAIFLLLKSILLFQDLKPELPFYGNPIFQTPELVSFIILYINYLLSSIRLHYMHSV